MVFSSSKSGEITMWQMARVYIYTLAICHPRYDFKKCKKLLPKNLWVLVLVLMKKENEGIALDANVQLFIVHLFTLSYLSKWSG